MDKEKMDNLANLVVDDILRVKEGDRILVLTDDHAQEAKGLAELRDAIIDVMLDRGFDPCVLSFKARTKKGADIPMVAEAACKESDVLLTATTYSFLHSGNFPRIYQDGKTKRHLLMLPSGVNVGQTDYFDDMMPESEEELLEYAEVTRKYGEVLKIGKEHNVHLTAANGTDMTLKLGKMNGSVHCGICEDGTIEFLPAHTLALGVDEGSAKGRLVIDYSTALKREPLKDSIIFEIHNGYVNSITGGEEAEDFIAAADAVDYPPEEKLLIAEFGLGFDPKAKVGGYLSDGERISGAAHIGIGSNITFGGSVFIPAWHVDCILPEATVEVDGQLILEDGKYLL